MDCFARWRSLLMFVLCVVRHLLRQEDDSPRRSPTKLERKGFMGNGNAAKHRPTCVFGIPVREISPRSRRLGGESSISAGKPAQRVMRTGVWRNLMRFGARGQVIGDKCQAPGDRRQSFPVFGR